MEKRASTRAEPELRDRLGCAGRYLAVTTGFNLVWELAQLPLYTIWVEQPLAGSLAAAAHCTLGDLLIAAAALAIAVALAGRGWPTRNYWSVALCAVVLGVAYALFSEWLNVEVRRTWAYGPLMPRLPWIGTGLTPVLQWLVVPTTAFVMLRRLARSGSLLSRSSNL